MTNASGLWHSEKLASSSVPSHRSRFLDFYWRNTIGRRCFTAAVSQTGTCLVCRKINLFQSSVVVGLFSFAWFWIWLLIVKNDPSEDKNMSKSERKFIQENQDFTRTEGKVINEYHLEDDFMASTF